ncbi:glutamyl endopeptidase [Fictibacillus macauensis ZFHKF-1]|uniref:Serine protease n=1 Tax=Fictibacillus macauensis ZFHKF-1 TaxID=1196324 RepID=I8AG36_9BACL|nr:trypsin-like peptidase domain-containing protein [Fictibacillus macauensis]EIT84354.1 glutamyl endopeptidase [Fictibacillus macauensis ZFHKF-1]
MKKWLSVAACSVASIVMLSPVANAKEAPAQSNIQMIKADQQTTSQLAMKHVLQSPKHFTAAKKIDGIIGKDDRKKVKSTASTPHRQIAMLLLRTNQNKNVLCSGTVIAKNKVLTAAHCVSQKGVKILGGYVYPAINSNNISEKYGMYPTKTFYIPSGWKKNENSKYDYAVIKVGTFKGKNIGTKVGTLPLKKKTKLVNATVKTYGYPGDKTKKNIAQWGMKGKIVGEDSYFAYSKMDVAGGQSGSSLLDSSNHIVGILDSYTWTDSKHVYSKFHKFNSTAYSFIKNAMKK